MKAIKRFVGMTLMTLALLLTVGTGAAFANTGKESYITDKIELNRELWLSGGVTYAPVKELAERMGWQLAYDGDAGTITVGNALGDKLTIRTGTSVVTFNGKTYDIAETVKVREGSAYVSLRTLADAMHASVEWQGEGKGSVVQGIDRYTVQAGDTLAEIAEAYGTTAGALKARNGLPSDALAAGRQLKVVVPEFLDPELADAALLAKLVEVEAGYESYQGKLAVANVVLNRVNSGRFPDTVKAVIYAKGQFPPAGKGMLKTETASAESVRAAKAALAGENNVPGALYFFNPQLEPERAKTADAVKTIGNHMFVK